MKIISIIMTQKEHEQTDMIYDDIGSYPLPEGTSGEWLKEAFAELSASTSTSTPTRREAKAEALYNMIADAMWQKINAGVELPNYPQFQNMLSQFSDPIMDDKKTEAPLLIRDEEARIVELEAIEGLAARYRADKGERLKLRICVTGPIELYYSQFQPPVYLDILLNIAKSVSRFIKHSIEQARNYEVRCVSIDEPSIGLDPRIEEEGMIKALEVASQFAFEKGIDTQIHLHSPIFYELVCHVKGIMVIGVESAANPALLNLIEKKQLENYDKFLRVGISRTDILSMAAEYDEKHHTRAFSDRAILEAIIGEYNSPERVKRRLEHAYSIFDERIRYVGPDCGLKSFPSQELAFMVLKNTADGIRAFRAGN